MIPFFSLSSGSYMLLHYEQCGKRTADKLRTLAAYIESRYGITLARAVSVNPAKMERILSGEEEPSYCIAMRVASYFFITGEVP